jgi:Glycerate kinase family
VRSTRAASKFLELESLGTIFYEPSVSARSRVSASTLCVDGRSRLGRRAAGRWRWRSNSAGARAIESGIREVFPDAEYVKVPVADGGEGTVQALIDATGGTRRMVEVVGPTGMRIACEPWRRCIMICDEDLQR